MKTCVVFDLDGVLANNTHRLHHIKQEKPDWDAFHDASFQDTPIWPAIRLFNACMAQGILPFIVTSRHERARQQTFRWLNANKLCIMTQTLIMRPNNCNDKAEIFKCDVMRRLQANDYYILCAFEDHPGVVAAYRAMGITCYAADPYNWDGPEIHPTTFNCNACHDTKKIWVAVDGEVTCPDCGYR